MGVVSTTTALTCPSTDTGTPTDRYSVDSPCALLYSTASSPLSSTFCAVGETKSIMNWLLARCENPSPISNEQMIISPLAL